MKIYFIKYAKNKYLPKFILMPSKFNINREVRKQTKRSYWLAGSRCVGVIIQTTEWDIACGLFYFPLINIFLLRLWYQCIFLRPLLRQISKLFESWCSTYQETMYSLLIIFAIIDKCKYELTISLDTFGLVHPVANVCKQLKNKYIK